MSDPISSLIGAKYSTILAGFLGSLVGLSFLKVMRFLQLFIALGVGAITPLYATPLVMYRFDLPKDLNDGVAFMVGVVAMVAIPVMLKAITLMGDDPINSLKKLFTKGL